MSEEWSDKPVVGWDNPDPNEYTEPGEAITISPEDSTAVIQMLQEADPMDNPTITVIGVLNGSKIVRADWNGNTTTLSDRTISAVEKIGITVVDDKENYLI